MAMSGLKAAGSFALSSLRIASASLNAAGVGGAADGAVD
jgi:hypothetical protein